ncbi:hypothetical protein PO909_020247 [Leuciscus waleckii]
MFCPHPQNKSREGHEVKLPLRGIYSDLITSSGKSLQQTYTQGPVTQQSLLCRTGYESNSRKTALLKTLSDLDNVLENNWQEPSTQLQHETEFHPGSYAPKVQIAYTCPPGHVPRKVEIERRRREYQKLDISKLLTEQGIDSNQLMPRYQTSAETENPYQPVSNNLSLETFDNEEFDCCTPEEWLALGYEQGSIDRKPVPAKALLPTKNSIPPGTL